jgi:CheY-like chemotaxis protein
MPAEPCSVVVANDDSEVRHLVGEYLTGCGFRVLETDNGLEALLLVKRALPAAIVLDIHMPRLDGVELLRSIRAFYPSVVVAVVTGDENLELHRRMVDLGAAAVFVKPVPLPALAATLTGSTGGRDPEPADPAPTAPSSATPADRVSVLVIDDDAAVRELLVDYCVQAGYEVRAAADAASGLREVVGAAPHVILLDIQMPGLSGVQALPALQAVAPDASIVMVSGTADADVARDALTQGAFDYVTKPIDFEYLARTLETAITLRREQ